MNSSFILSFNKHYRNTSKQFRLTVYTTQSTNNEEKNMYSKRCYMQESCTLNCPDEHAPDVKTMNMTSNSIIWHKVIFHDMIVECEAASPSLMTSLTVESLLLFFLFFSCLKLQFHFLVAG